MGIMDAAIGFMNVMGVRALSGLQVSREFLGTNINTNKTSKKNKIRGKVPTRSQRQILVDNGVSEKEQELYLIQKISLVQEGKDKRLNQSSNKVENWTLVHRDTGELKEVYIT